MAMDNAMHYWIISIIKATISELKLLQKCKYALNQHIH